MAQSTESYSNTPSHEAHLPAIAAAFLVSFDNRKGYTLTWQKALDGVQLEGVVEFKTLPSGLHNVDEDLVYFVHEDYVGTSAFLKRDDESAARNARMLAVGVLLQVTSGRMGKSWLYAQKLKDLARGLLESPDNFKPLEEFWDNHREKENNSPVQTSSVEASPTDGYRKPRALSTGSISTPNRMLPAHHPAIALPSMLSAFGPLIFPLFRAALLRKRILIVGEAPVEDMCDYVHDISILSSISVLVGAHLPTYDPSRSRLKPLFNIGISDISTLESMKEPWIACTTDDVLCSKPHLFDMLVILPNSTTLQKDGNKRYPKLILSSPELSKSFPRHGILASQRDARRYSALKKTIHLLPSGASLNVQMESDSDDAKSTMSSVSTIFEKREAVETLPLTVMAYNSLIWWVSAGDRRSGLLEAEELANEQDEEMMRECVAEEATTKEVTMVAYFHKLATLIFSVLNSAVRRYGPGDYRDEEEEAEEGETDTDHDGQSLLPSKSGDEEVVEISEEDVRAMGLDIWSEPDKHFITEMLIVWWKRQARVRGGVIECCGIRIL